MPRRRGQGEGSLEPLPSGKWRAVLTDGKKPDGSQNKISATFDKRSQASEWLEEQRGLRRMGATFAQSAMSVEKWLEQWLKLMKCRVSAGSWKAYSTRCRLHLIPLLGKYEMRQVTALFSGQIPAQLEERGATAKTIRQVMKTLRQSLKEAVRLKVIYADPMAGLPLPRVEKKEMRCWTREEARKFLESVKGHRHYALFLLALDTGMRKGELLGLMWKDVILYPNDGYLDVHRTLEDIDGELQLKAPKTKKSRRRIWFGEASRNALRELLVSLRELGPVFQGRRGSFMWPETINRSFAEAVKKAGVPRIRFHDLRHTCATLLLQAGVGIKTVSERLGHANVTITLDTYTHVLPGEQQAVAKKVDEIFGVSHPHPTEKAPETSVQVNYVFTGPGKPMPYDLD